MMLLLLSHRGWQRLCDNHHLLFTVIVLLASLLSLHKTLGESGVKRDRIISPLVVGLGRWFIYLFNA